MAAAGVALLLMLGLALSDAEKMSTWRWPFGRKDLGGAKSAASFQRVVLPAAPAQAAASDPGAALQLVRPTVRPDLDPGNSPNSRNELRLLWKVAVAILEGNHPTKDVSWRDLGLIWSGVT
jgi:hypothetical protein